jgi:hypothetical protein
MAGVSFSCVTTAETALAAAVPKTLIRLIPPSSHVVLIKEWGVFFDGVSVTAEPVLITIATCTTAITGSYTAHTAVKRTGPPIVAQTLCQTMNSNTSEPAITGVICMREVHPQSGYQEKFAFGDEITCTGAVFIQVTAPATVSAIAELVFSE